MSANKNLAIVERIKKLLKLGDAGKLESFFGKVVKALTREIGAIQQNLKTLKFTFDQEMDALKEQLEDAEDGVQAALENVSVKNVENNAAQNSYLDSYWAGIETAEAKHKVVQDAMKTLEEDYKENVKSMTAEVEIRQNRMTKITGE